MKKHPIIFLSSLVVCLPAILSAPVYKVEMIAELFRHGARTSIHNPLNEEFNKIIG